MLASVFLAAALVTGSPFGACSHLSGHEFEARDGILKLMGVGGLRTVRFDVYWGWQKTPEAKIDFSRYAAVAESAEREGVELLPILDAPPKWALPTQKHLPEFKAYVQEVLKHLGDKCPAFEIWNEQNLASTEDVGNPTNYLAVLKVAYETIKAAKPTARVGLGGVSHVSLNYVREVYRLGGAKYFDFICCHPYTIPFAPEGRLEEDLESLRKLMSEFGDAEKPIWATEVGYPTHRNGIGTTGTQVLQAGLRIARPQQKTWRAAYVPIVADGKTPSQEVAETLLEVLPRGSTAVAASTSELKALLAKDAVDLVVLPFDSEGYIGASMDAIIDFVKRGGVVVENGGVPMYEAYAVDAVGGVNKDNSRVPWKDRRELHIDFAAWWTDRDLPQKTTVFATKQALDAGFKAHPAGYDGHRFLIPRYLRPGDEMIPLLTGKSLSGKEIVAAAVYRLNSDAKGAVVVSGIGVGWGPVAHDERQQALYLARAAAISIACGLEKFYAYEFLATEQEAYYSEHHFGIVHRNLSPKPAYCAYSTLAGRRPTGSVTKPGAWRDAAEKLYWPQWTRPDHRKSGMVWQVSEPKSMELTFDAGWIEFMDAFGKPLAFPRTGDRSYLVKVGDSPIYFTGGHLASKPGEKR